MSTVSLKPSLPAGNPTVAAFITEDGKADAFPAEVAESICALEEIRRAFRQGVATHV